MATTFSQKVKEVIRQIPAGRVATYGQVAAIAGNPWAVRGVVWVLHSSSDKENLPWQRVVNARGRISLGRNQGYKRQKALLESEGVTFDSGDVIDLDRYLWSPGGGTSKANGE
jgi:methylated-DNA-protein-cysteine methyltransferase-like protein